MEIRLFERGAGASHAYTMWKLYGTRRICVSETALRSSVLGLRNSTGTGAGTAGTAGAGEKTPAAGKRGSSHTVSPEENIGGRKRSRAY